MANALRALAMDAVEQAKSGHPGMPMGMADIATVLFTHFLRFDPQAPDWPDRDRFVLSNGHGSMLLYGLLHLTGYPDMTLDELKRFRQLGSRTAGHPERGLATGIETTTGPLGQGLGNSVGMALAERHLAAEFGDDLVDHHTYVFCGDGCLMEGISHEALSLAGHLQAQQADRALGRQLDLDRRPDRASRSPTTSSSGSGRMAGRPSASTASTTTRSPPRSARAQTHDRPSLIACRTIIAFGAPTKAGTAAAHGSPLGAEEIKGAKERLGWEYGPFVVPDDVRAEWRAGRRARRRRAAGMGAAACRRAGRQARPSSSAASRANCRPDFDAVIAKVCDDFRAKNAKIATRQASGAVLDALVPAVPELIGGSADLTPSNNTKAKDQADIKPGDFAGRYIRYGVREHGWRRR